MKKKPISKGSKIKKLNYRTDRNPAGEITLAECYNITNGALYRAPSCGASVIQCSVFKD